MPPRVSKSRWRRVSDGSQWPTMAHDAECMRRSDCFLGSIAPSRGTAWSVRRGHFRAVARLKPTLSADRKIAEVTERIEEKLTLLKRKGETVLQGRKALLR